MRKIVLTGIAVGVAATTALATSALAQGGQPTQWVNGGGQIIASSQSSGPGETIAFTVQKTTGGDRGQVQYNAHDGSTKWHSASIICSSFQDNTAVFAGTTNTDGSFFEVWVTDNGSGPDGTDLVTINYPSDQPDCTEDSPDQTTELGRGNVTIHTHDS